MGVKKPGSSKSPLLPTWEGSLDTRFPLGFLEGSGVAIDPKNDPREWHQAIAIYKAAKARGSTLAEAQESVRHVVFLIRQQRMPGSRIFLFEDPILEARASRWVKISNSKIFQRLEGGNNTHFFLSTIQRLGRLDCNLIHVDNWINTLKTFEQRNERENMIRCYDHETNSVLWVVGAFGLVYTIEKMMYRNKMKFPGLHNRISSLNRKLNRLRRTFAKGDPQEGDYLHPHSAMRFKGSTCWGVNLQTYISRIDLSDELLELLTAIDAHPGPYT